MNSVNIVGRLVKDPELKYSQSGVAICRFTVAVNRSFSNQQGEREADFPNVVCFKKQAENLANYMRKGSQVGITGRLQTGSYEKQDGTKVFTTEVLADNIQFLEPKNSGQNNQQPQYQQPQQQMTQQQMYQPPQDNDPFAPGGGPIEITDDDLPF